MNTSVVLLVALTVGLAVGDLANNETAPSAAPSVAKDLLKKIFGGALASPHIVGGGEVRPHSHPFQVALLCTSEKGQQALCGGSLIAPQWVLTAAHCTTVRKEIIAVLGAHNLQRYEAGRQVIPVQRVVSGGGNEEKVDNDIALLELSKPAVLNKHVKTIRLPPLRLTRKALSHTSVVISGWGRYNDRKEDSSPFLRAARSRIIDNRWCNFVYYGRITNKMLCVDGSEGRGVCQGDSGGPLIMTESDGERTLIGVTSFGSKEGCESGYPTVFTRVDQYLPSIARYTGITLRK